MQSVSKRLGAVALGVCLLAALVFGGVTAFAAVSWQGASFGNTLTIEATNNDEMKDDVAKADVVVDVYRVATAEKDASFDTYNYTWESPFGTGAVDTSKLNAAGWQELAVNAAKAVGVASTKPDFVTTDAGKALEGIDNGLYLLMAHGKDADVTFAADGTPELHAYSDIYDYVFEPVLVAVPSKAADESGVIRTDDSYGPWLTDVAVTLKPERDPQYGSLRITKTVTRNVGEPRSFVFHITGELPDGTPYGPEGKGQYAQVYFEEGTYNETIVEHIPAGSKLTVTEELTSGTGYRLVSGDSETKIIVADRLVSDTNSMASAAFVNEPDGSTDHGYGIENKFVLSKTGEGESDWDWEWIAVPEQPNPPVQQ